jgi:hypothetical protein
MKERYVKSKKRILGVDSRRTMLSAGLALMAVIILYSAQVALAQPDNVTVLPGQGVDFKQVSFMPPAPDEPNSDYGQVSIDPETLFNSTGISGGYLNIFTDAGWVMQNLRVNLSDGVTPFVSYFSLGIIAPMKVTMLSAHMEFTPIPQQNFTDGPRSNFSVGAVVWSAAGSGFVNVTPPIISVASRNPISAPASNPVLSGDPDTWYTLPDPVNVLAANNQCVTMALANSLQYLKLQFGINVPHDHIPGLKGDNTLVGQLDTATDRGVRNRRDGDGLTETHMLKGKFLYLNNNGLKDQLINEHQGRGWDLPDGDITYSGITSKDEGKKITFDFICDQIKNGEDVELAWAWPGGGGHEVRVFACGTTAGIQRIGYVSDDGQRDNPTDLHQDFEEVKDFANDGTLDIGIKTNFRKIISVMSESPISGSIHGSKFNDLNGNGVKDLGEPGLDGWEIKLTKPDKTTESKMTDANGNYKFNGLAAGTYTVEEVLQPGWIQTALAGLTYTVTLSSEQNVRDMDFGNFQLGSISGMKFNDLNGNGVKDLGEPGLDGWTITLTGPSGTMSTVTSNGGKYKFDGLMADTYTVEEVLQPGWKQTAPSGLTYTVTISSGQNVMDKDFGNKQYSIYGMKFNDLNGNRKKDPGEPGLAGWHIRLVGVDTLTNTPVNREEITDANGNYGFRDVSPGIYQVFEVMQGPNWVPTTPVTVPIVNKKAIMGINVNFGNKQIP